MSDRKTVTLRQEAYDDLDDVTGDDESFSDSIIRLVESTDDGGEQTANTPPTVEDIGAEVERRFENVIENLQQGRY